MLSRIIESRESLLAFRQIDFRRFIFSKFMLTLALQVQFVVISWQVYELTKDPLSLGLIGLSEAIPAIALALYGGFVSDRNDRRKILMIVMSTQFFVSLSLLLVSLYYENNPFAKMTAWPFYVVMFFVGVLRAFFSPAQFPLISQIVPRTAYANASAWNSTFWQFGVVLGSMSGGILLSFLGKNITYMIVLTCILIAVIQMFRITKRPVQSYPLGEGMMTSIRKGLRFVFGNQVILGALTLDLIAVLFGGAVALLPIFAAEVLMVGEKGYGILRAAPFAGSVIMALVLTKYPPLKNTGKKLLYSVAGFSACMIAFALSKNFVLSFCLLALSGSLDSISVVIRASILQYLTPDDMRGRVSSVSTMFISSSNEIGAFEQGFAARILGLVPSVIFGGSVGITSVLAASVWMPKLRKLQLKDY